MLIFIPLQPVIADVEDVVTDNGGINKTNPSDGSDESGGGGGDDIPWWKKALDKVVDVGVDLKDQLSKIGKDLNKQWNDFLDSSEEFFKDVSDWFDKTWNEVGDWLDKNKWVQTIIAAVLATVVIVAVIVGLVALGVVGAISIAVVAVIAVGALAGGFIYQWIAGDNYSFWGALGSSTIGGILGYLGMASGAFASAGGWLRTVAWPAVKGWFRNTAIPWITGRWQAGVNWVRTVAFPFIRTKFRAGVNFVRTKFTAGMNWIKTTAFPWVRGKAIAGWNLFKGFVQNPVVKWGFTVGSAAGLFSSLATSLRTGEFSVASLLIDTIFGGITGGLTAPFLVGSISVGTLLGLSLYGGIENTIGEALKTGFNDGWNEVDWFGYESARNFFLGSIVAGLSIKLSSLLPNLGHEIVVDSGTKFTEEWVKDFGKGQVDNLFDKNSSPNKTGENTNKIEPPQQKDKQNYIKEPDNQVGNLEKDIETNIPKESKPIQPPMAPIQ